MANSHIFPREQELLISEEIYYKIIDISESKRTSFGSQGSLILYFQGYGNANIPLFSILTLTGISEKVQLSHLAANQLRSLPGFHDDGLLPPHGIIAAIENTILYPKYNAGDKLVLLS